MKRLLLIALIASFGCGEKEDEVSVSSRESEVVTYNYYDEWMDEDSSRHYWTPDFTGEEADCKCNVWSEEASDWLIVDDSECVKAGPCD